MGPCGYRLIRVWRPVPRRKRGNGTPVVRADDPGSWCARLRSGTVQDGLLTAVMPSDLIVSQEKADGVRPCRHPLRER
jgi:hypothetical protein